VALGGGYNPCETDNSIEKGIKIKQLKETNRRKAALYDKFESLPKKRGKNN
jgi:hypothetical protein